MRIFDHLASAALDAPQAPALVHAGRTSTYGELWRDAQRTAGGLRQLGIAAGQAVGLMLPNSIDFVSLAYGTLAAGCVLVPLNVLLTARELVHQLAQSRLRLLFVDVALRPVAEAAAALLPVPLRIIGVDAQGRLAAPWPLQPADGAAGAAGAEGAEGAARPAVDVQAHAVTIFTTGTTEAPKGVMLSHANLCAQVEMMRPCFPVRPGDRGLCALPLFHSYGLNCALAMAIRERVTLVLQSRFTPEDCARSLADDGVSWFAGVPTMYTYLLRYAQAVGLRFPSLRWCLSGGAALPQALAQAWEQHTGVPIYEGYGLTETTVSVSSNRPGAHRPGSVGQPYAGVELRVVDDAGRDCAAGSHGEVMVSGPNLFMGYLNCPDVTAGGIDRGWWRTGDIGYLDADGFCFLSDRKSDLIIKGGRNIHPREIEEVLATAPGVLEVAVVGVPDALYGERVCAVIVPRPGATFDVEALRERLRDNLARYKHPAEYRLVAALPKAANGKVLKRVLRSTAPALEVAA